MINEPAQATSQPAEAPTPASEAKSDAKVPSNLTVAQAAQRLLNMQAENAAAQATVAEQVAQPETAEKPAPTEAAPAESVESSEVQSEASAEDHTDDDDTVPSQTDPELKKSVQKRISKEVAKRKALEAELNELKLQMQAAKQESADSQQVPVAQIPQGDMPLSQIQDMGQLETLAKQAKEAKRWAQQQLADPNFEPIQVGDKVLGRKELTTIIINSEQTLEDDIPVREKFLKQREEARKIAYQEFPFLADKSKPEYVAARQAYMQLPWLHNLPNSDWIIGVQIEGLKAMEARKRAATAKPAKNPAISSRPPSSQTVATAASSESRTPSASKSQAQIESLRQQLSKKGGVTTNEAVQFLLAREAAKQAR